MSLALLLACESSMGREAMTPADPGPMLTADGGMTPPVAPVDPDAGSLPPVEPPPVEPPPVVPPPVGGNGCGRDPGANDRVWTLSHGGRERTFYVHLPPSYDRNAPTPLVVNFHGRTGSPAGQAQVSGMPVVSDEHGFIVAHPTGIGATWNGGLCCGEAMSSNIDDVGFVNAMLNAIEQELCIDTQRIFATGLSNGGYMSHRLACELADRIAAIGPVAGPNMMVVCEPARPIPVFHFHGTADSIVPYEGFAGRLTVPETMSGWVARNGCNPTSTTFFQEGDVRCEEWSGCTDNATVRLCTIDGGGHQWPGGLSIPFLGHNTNVISASRMMWEFFAAHPMPSR